MFTCTLTKWAMDVFPKVQDFMIDEEVLFEDRHYILLLWLWWFDFQVWIDYCCVVVVDALCIDKSIIFCSDDIQV